MSNKWVSAVTEPMAGLNTLGTCLGLADLVGDGDQKLVLADLGTGRYNMRLKVFKGVVLVAESALVDAPSALVPFFMESVRDFSPPPLTPYSFVLFRHNRVYRRLPSPRELPSLSTRTSSLTTSFWCLRWR